MKSHSHKFTNKNFTQFNAIFLYFMLKLTPLNPKLTGFMMHKRSFLNVLSGILGLLFLFFSGCSSAVFNTNSTINNNINPPSDIRALSDVNTIAFEWKLVQDPSVMGYYIYRKEANQTDFKKIATLESRFNTHYADNDLKAGTTYIYHFTTFDKDHNVSSYSPAVSATTLSIAAVTYAEAISNYPRKVKIIWSPHQDPRVVGYIVQRKDKNGEWKEVGNIKSRLLVEFLDTKLEDETTYTYQVLAYNAKNSLSIPSSPVSATTKPKPVPITGFQATLDKPKQKLFLIRFCALLLFLAYLALLLQSLAIQTFTKMSSIKMGSVINTKSSLQIKMGLIVLKAVPLLVQHLQFQAHQALLMRALKMDLLCLDGLQLMIAQKNTLYIKRIPYFLEKPCAIIKS